MSGYQSQFPAAYGSAKVIIAEMAASIACLDLMPKNRRAAIMLATDFENYAMRMEDFRGKGVGMLYHAERLREAANVLRGHADLMKVSEEISDAATDE